MAGEHLLGPHVYAEPAVPRGKRGQHLSGAAGPARPVRSDHGALLWHPIQLIVGAAAAGSPLYRYYAAYLDALDARQRSQAERIRRQWLDLNRLTAARLSELNPHWDASLWSSMFVHNTTLLCDAADQDLLGNYHAISASYLLLDQLACEMGEYMSVGIIRQFHIS